MELIQDKLDARNKIRSNLFNWRGQFTPEFVDYILDNFILNDNIVGDPFSGSGTVLLECARKGLSCYGYEINPAAYIMSKFFTFCNLSLLDRRYLVSSVSNKLTGVLPNYKGLPLFEEKDSFRNSFSNLIKLSKELFFKMTNPMEKMLSAIILFTAEDYKNGDLVSLISKAFNYVTNTLICLPYSDKQIVASLIDARLIGKTSPPKFNLIVTSPPYINVFNYHQNHRAIIEVLGWDILKIAESEIGSNRKNRSNRFKTIVQYCLDMELVLNNIWECLSDDGTLILVVGRQSNVRGVPFSNVGIVKDIATNMGSFYSCQNFTRSFVNKFGLEIKEDILVLPKASKPPHNNVAKNIALQHLNAALTISPSVVQSDLLNTIECIDQIIPSPFLSDGGVL